MTTRTVKVDDSLLFEKWGYEPDRFYDAQWKLEIVGADGSRHASGFYGRLRSIGRVIAAEWTTTSFTPVLVIVLP